MSNPTKAELVLAEIVSRIQAELPTARVETGWVVLYAPDNATWPLVTIAPADDDASGRSPTVLDQSRRWEIQAAISIDDPAAAVPQLEQLLVALRKALIVPKTADRLGIWGGLLKTQPQERERVVIVPPGPGEQYAGLNLLLQTDFIQPL